MEKFAKFKSNLPLIFQKEAMSVVDLEGCLNGREITFGYFNFNSHLQLPPPPKNVFFYLGCVYKAINIPRYKFTLVQAIKIEGTI